MSPSELMSLSLPGAALVAKRLDDLARGGESTQALLVSIGRPRRLWLGFSVPERYDRPELRLYQRRATEHGDAAHSRYNALLRRLVSFERAAAYAKEPTQRASGRSCVRSQEPRWKTPQSTSISASIPSAMKCFVL